MLFIFFAGCPAINEPDSKLFVKTDRARTTESFAIFTPGAIKLSAATQQLSPISISATIIGLFFLLICYSE